MSSFNYEVLYLFPEHEQVKMNSNLEEEKLIIKILFDAITTDLNEKQKEIEITLSLLKINEICKKYLGGHTNLWTN